MRTTLKHEGAELEITDEFECPDVSEEAARLYKVSNWVKIKIRGNSEYVRREQGIIVSLHDLMASLAGFDAKKQ